MGKLVLACYQIFAKILATLFTSFFTGCLDGTLGFVIIFFRSPFQPHRVIANIVYIETHRCHIIFPCQPRHKSPNLIHLTDTCPAPIWHNILFFCCTFFTLNHLSSFLFCLAHANHQFDISLKTRPLFYRQEPRNWSLSQKGLELRPFGACPCPKLASGSDIRPMQDHCTWLTSNAQH